MPKHFLKNSKTISKKSRKRHFDPQNGQNADVNLAKSVDFLVHFRSTSFIFAFLVQIFFKIVPAIAIDINIFF